MDALEEPATDYQCGGVAIPVATPGTATKKKSHAVQKAFFPTHHNEGSDTAAASSMRVT